MLSFEFDEDETELPEASLLLPSAELPHAVKARTIESAIRIASAFFIVFPPSTFAVILPIKAKTKRRNL